jgi:DNA mismatch endonuclease (patch repair protein)
MDRLTPTRRSYLMSRVRSRDTEPEMAVRRTAHGLGFRFRLHARELPGSPDLVFPRLRSLVFVHGCFWHRHPGCEKASNPSTRIEFWRAKFGRNIARDAAVRRELEALGWRILVVWECEAKDLKGLRVLIGRFLSKP